MKQKHNGGFSLIETVVAIAILGLIVVPCCSGLLMAIRINEKAQQMMQAQLTVSSAVETLMAEGIRKEIIGDSLFITSYEDSEQNNLMPYDFFTLDENGNIVSRDKDRFANVEISVTPNANASYCTVKVRDEAKLVEVTTSIRVVKTPESEQQGGGGQ